MSLLEIDDRAAFNKFTGIVEFCVVITFGVYGFVEFYKKVVEEQESVIDVNIFQFITQSVVVLSAFGFWIWINCSNYRNIPNWPTRQFSSCNCLQCIYFKFHRKMAKRDKARNKKDRVSTAVHKALICRRLFFVSVFQLVSLGYRNTFYYYGGWIYCLCELLMLYWDILKHSNADNWYDPCKECWIWTQRPTEARLWVDDNGNVVEEMKGYDVGNENQSLL